MNRSLRELLFAAYGSRAEDILHGYLSPRPTTLRINPLRGSAESVKREFSVRGISFREAEFPAGALLLEEGGEQAVRETEAYARGEVYVQSLSSMLPPIYLDARAGEDVLDMTAAPGGKAAQICALTGGKVLLTACERDSVRFQRMKFNFERQGARVNAVCADALSLDEALSFDKILLDAPCSGSGTVRGESARIDEAFVERCALRQEKLIKKAYKLLKRGGTLVYSTCSVLPRENGEALLGALKGLRYKINPLDPPLDAALLPSVEGTVCICPNERYEGFFISSVTKE